MKIPDLIEKAKKKTSLEISDLLLAEIGKTIDKAIKAAKKENEFVALSTLTLLAEKFPNIEARNLNLTEQERKCAHSVTISCGKNVSNTVINAMFETANSIGDVVTQSTHMINVLMKSLDANKFVIQVKQVKGCEASIIRPTSLLSR